jgi:hypothetical protein
VAHVKAFEIPGIACWIFSADHRPPHLHAKRGGEWEALVFFLEPKRRMIEMKWSKKPMSRKDRKLLVDHAERRRDALLEQWDQIQGDSQLARSSF